MRRAADDHGFLAQLADYITQALESYDLSSEEKAALSIGDVSWIENHVGKLDTALVTWLNADVIRRSGKKGDVMEGKLENILKHYKGKHFELIPVLQEVQHSFGYLPEPEMREVAKFVGVAESRVYAVATFFEQFKFTPQGKNHIVVCRGTACHVRGAKRILEEFEEKLNIKEGETTEDLEYTLGTAACIGCCALAPCVMINDEVEAKLTPKKVADFFSKETADGI